MANSFQIDIITPVENINIGTSEYLRAPNLDGLFGVQARHVSSIISIGFGEIKITQEGKEKFYSTTGGYADIRPEGVVLLVENVEKASDIDIKRAEEAVMVLDADVAVLPSESWVNCKKLEGSTNCLFLFKSSSENENLSNELNEWLEQLPARHHKHFEIRLELNI